jgi:hypothetical protein
MPLPGRDSAIQVERRIGVRDRSYPACLGRRSRLLPFIFVSSEIPPQGIGTDPQRPRRCLFLLRIGFFGRRKGSECGAPDAAWVIPPREGRRGSLFEDRRRSL